MTDEQDQRRLLRVRTILAAQAVPGKGLPTINCQVKDLSETGARITVDDTVFLPDRFEFRIPKRHMARIAEVRWRQGSVIGIHFVTDTRAAGSPDPAERIKELEAENAELRRRVVDMVERLYAYGASERPVVGDSY